jgi:ABC-type uncharacterized transport system permease subunit
MSGCYLGATLLMLTDFLRRERRFQNHLRVLLLLGFALSTLDLTLHALLSAEMGNLPFAGSSQVFDVLAWAFVALALFNLKEERLFPVSGLLIPLAFVCSLLGLLRHETMVPHRGQLTDALFALHVGVLAFGTVCFCFSFLAGLLYLLAQRELKSRRFGRVLTLLPPLQTLDRAAVQSLVVGILLLTVGNATGIYLAHVFWKVNWLAQTKFLLSMATWAWFVALLSVRHFAGWRGSRFFASIVIGFAALLFTLLLSVVWKVPWT